MIEETGRVIRIDGSMAVVAMNRHGACEHCDICTAGKQDLMEVTAINTLGAKVNDLVKVAISGPVILKTAFLVYMIPLFGLFFGYFLGKYFGGEKFGVSAGIGAVILILSGLHYYDRKLQREKKTLVQITAIL